MSVLDKPDPKPRASQGIVVPHQPKPLQCLVAKLVFVVERCVTASLRCHWNDCSGLAAPQNGQPVIFCLWHNRLAIAMVVHRKYPRKLAALVSASKDGALLAAVLRTFGVEQVRGSSSRRGPQALLELTSRAAAGYDLAVTPDGPKGPRYIVQKGVIALAQVTGSPIVPVTCNTPWKLCLKSWDGFQIPLPFSKCELLLHAPMVVPRQASDQDREELRVDLERTLRAGSRD
ncbi:MAG TPA: lysophospholipid acyltransferase family protein [Bacillota bacterium]|nr:lysophospholipid acyltransferase family protein [Bacillota bacterium]